MLLRRSKRGYCVSRRKRQQIPSSCCGKAQKGQGRRRAGNTVRNGYPPVLGGPGQYRSFWLPAYSVSPNAIVIMPRAYATIGHLKWWRTGLENWRQESWCSIWGGCDQMRLIQQRQKLILNTVCLEAAGITRRNGKYAQRVIDGRLPAG